MDLNKVTFFLITGASRGIGKTMAIECCRHFQPGSVAVLIARSEKGLEETKKEILSVNGKITVQTYPMDLSRSTSEVFQTKIKNALAKKNPTDFQQAFIVHNVGTVGDISKRAKELDDTSAWSDYFQLNVFCVAALNSVFMKSFADIPKIVVNVTSECTTAPVKSFTLYCSGKAARELYFRVLAKEEPTTVVLNYSPGHVDTDMAVEVEANTVDDDIREYFKKYRETKANLAPIQTVTKFLQIFKEFKFKSGDHVYYFD